MSCPRCSKNRRFAYYEAMKRLDQQDIRRTVVLTGTRVGYSRGGPKDKEVDIVVDYPNIKKILIEVKYREQAPIPNDDAIIELSKEASAAIIVTKRADDYGAHDTPDGRQLIRIPAFALLYLLGNAEKYGYKGRE